MQYRTAHEAGRRIREQNNQSIDKNYIDWDYLRRKRIDNFYKDKNFTRRTFKCKYFFGFHIESFYINHFDLINLQIIDIKKKIKSTYRLLLYTCLVLVSILGFIVYMTFFNNL